jgi:hypothetical protein
MGKSYLRHLELDKELLTEEDIMRFLRMRNAKPHWSDESGLVFRPRVVGERTRKMFQRILGIHWRDEGKGAEAQAQRI